MKNHLKINPEKISNEIAEFIENKRIQLNRDGLIIGLSGGLDSAVTAYLAARGTDKRKVNLIYLPEKDSKKIHKKDAQIISHELGIPLQVENITHILESIEVYKLLPLRFFPGKTTKDLLVSIGKKVENVSQENLLSARFSPKPNSLIAKGNEYGTIKHRIRMVMIYHHANLRNLLVVGAANRTELLTGAFSQWGCDQCADIMPIIHLFRTQIEVIAEYLNIPISILKKSADPDIMPGVGDKEELIGPFNISDQILWLLENGYAVHKIAEEYEIDIVNHVNDLYQKARFMREVPYNLL
jgi:NAD+ synthase